MFFLLESVMSFTRPSCLGVQFGIPLLPTSLEFWASPSKKITSNDKAPSVDSQVQADDKRPPEIFMQVRLTVYPEVKGRGFQWEVEIYENLLPGSSGSVSANSTSNSICWLVPLYRLKLRMVALLLYCEGRSSWILSTGGSRTSGRSFNQFQHHFVLQRSSSGSFMLSAGFVVCSRVEVSIKSQFWCLDHTSYTENYWVQQQVKTFRNMFDSPHSTLLLLFAPLLVQMKAPHYTENKWKWIPSTWCLILRQGLVQLESIKTSENTAHLAACNLLPRQVSLLFMSLFFAFRVAGYHAETESHSTGLHYVPSVIYIHLSFKPCLLYRGIALCTRRMRQVSSTSAMVFKRNSSICQFQQMPKAGDMPQSQEVLVQLSAGRLINQVLG